MRMNDRLQQLALFVRTGEQQVKNISRPVRAYVVRLDGSADVSWGGRKEVHWDDATLGF